ncbi:MAG: DUF3160 domain-containing protein [Butyrivibrio sp.]|nr:DUF3160 domain-containing protein [Butyrivibrio sp.]
MKKRVLAALIAATMVMSACGSAPRADEAAGDVTSQQVTEDNSDDFQTGAEAEKEPVAEAQNENEVTDEEIYYDVNLVPSVEPYKVAEDFSNVEYEDEFDNWFNPSHEYASETAAELRQGLITNNFAVVRDSYNEFFDVYESNRYLMFPNFVTVDSLMHTYHLYFAYLMKQTERDFLSDRLKTLTQSMMEESVNQYKELQGSEWKEAALRNMEFFYVAELLQDNAVSAVPNDAEFNSVVHAEYDKIMEAAGIEECALTGKNEDYTQYKPRGYYEGDENLEKYFRTMMWYGRIGFPFESQEMVKSAVLMSLAIDKDPEAWKDIYKITGFFAGASDDPGYDQVITQIESAYGQIPEAKDLVGNEAALNDCGEKLMALDPPKINSIPVREGENPVIPSYRFLGQRFTIDAAIMQRLVYSAVEENENGERRYLPDTLDVAAALGSETALDILKEQGDTEYKNYNENLFFAREHFDNSDASLWDASLYSGWLNILRPLFEQKKEGYPSYMQSEEWTKKNLETFAGSFAELKHDTILYSKQLMAEMGGGDMEVLDDRGYVDPQPVIYSRFIALSEKTKKGLEECGMLGSGEKENLEKLTEIAKRLLEISEKELTNAEITEDDYEFIRCYGGYIEHFWIEVNKEEMEEAPSDSFQAPSPVVADIATDPNGTVLEVGTGKVDTLYVVFPIDGKLHIGRGSVYSFYQFEMPISERMTDSEWRNRLAGGYLDDDWNWVEADKAPEQPQWTSSYRVGNR